VTTATAFRAEDVELLLGLYTATPSDTEPRRPPWTWAALNQDESLALLRMCNVFVSSYNMVHALDEKELIPPCWALHHELAAEIPVQVWLYYAAHLDAKASPLIASDWYGRHLPGFRSRVDRMLGGGPKECRKGEHPPDWRKPVDDLIAKYEGLAGDEDGARATVELLGDLHFGFSHLNP
jgi:hypothetical protein